MGFKLERLTINIDLGLTCCVILGTECNLSEPWVSFLILIFFTFIFGCVGSPLWHGVFVVVCGLFSSCGV